jgi:hypothetical protein
MAIARPGEIAKEAWRYNPRVSGAAQSFVRATRWITAVSAAVTVFMGFVFVARGWGAILAGTIGAVGTFMVVIAFTTVATDMVSGYANSRKVSSGPVSESILRFANAPLALTPVVAVLLVLAAAVGTPTFVNIVGWLAWWLLLAILVLWWLTAIRMTAKATRGELGQLITQAIMLPMGWMVVGFFCAIIEVVVLVVATVLSSGLNR